MCGHVENYLHSFLFLLVSNLFRLFFFFFFIFILVSIISWLAIFLELSRSGCMRTLLFLNGSDFPDFASFDLYFKISFEIFLKLIKWEFLNFLLN